MVEITQHGRDRSVFCTSRKNHLFPGLTAGTSCEAEQMTEIEDKYGTI